MLRLERITIDPQICLGQPVIKNTRITVSMILKLVASGMSTGDICEAYPELTAEDISQSLQYAAWLTADKTRILPAHKAS